MTINAGRLARSGAALLGGLACCAAGCATWDDASYGVPVDAANRPQPAAASPALLVSASEAPTYSTTYLGLVEVTFENHTAVWKQVDHVSVEFLNPGKNQRVTIESGEDIDAWERAIVLGSGVQPLDTKTAIERLGVDAGDALGAWVGQNQSATAPARAGDVPAGPQASATPAPPFYPAQHLLTTPFRIPPGMFAKRWMLLSTSDDRPGACVDSMIVSYETSDHATGRVLLPFKIHGTDWQPAGCPVQTSSPYRPG